MPQVDVSATTHPVADYGEAAYRVETIQRRDGADVLPVAHTQFMAQGRKTERAIVFLHSLSNSPEQFYELGRRFFDYGYNVLIPRMPHHGNANRMTTEQSRLDGKMLLAHLNEAIDIAQGLGRHITVAGQSVGGVLAALGAQYRRDIDLAVPINPTFGVFGLPVGLSYRVAKMLLRLPNQFLWWDFFRGPRFGPDYIYPRVATHALAEGLLLANTALVSAQVMKPAARSILVVTHSKDALSTTSASAKIIVLWKQRGAAVRTHRFNDLPRLHDIIDPWSIGARMEMVYGKLLDLIATQA